MISKPPKHARELVQMLKNGLIASCQPVDNGPMDKPEHVAAMAQACLLGNAKALRIEGIENLAAVRKVTSAPIVGIIKRDLEGSDVRITPLLKDIENLASAGADIIAFDATDRARPYSAEALLQHIHQNNLIAMADCSNFEEGKYMAELGCTFIGSTLSGYTNEAITPKTPDLDLVSRWSKLGYPVIAEGRYNSPELAATAIQAGALAVTVGSAITRAEYISQWFSESILQAGQPITG